MSINYINYINYINKYTQDVLKQLPSGYCVMICNNKCGASYCIENFEFVHRYKIRLSNFICSFLHNDYTIFLYSNGVYCVENHQEIFLKLKNSISEYTDYNNNLSKKSYSKFSNGL